MTLEEAKVELEKFVKLKTTMRPAFVQPLLDAVEQKRGHWEMKPDPYGFFDEIPVCSECGCTTEMRKTYRFCPNCGAKMDEVEDETD